METREERRTRRREGRTARRIMSTPTPDPCPPTIVSLPASPPAPSPTHRSSLPLFSNTVSLPQATLPPLAGVAITRATMEVTHVQTLSGASANDAAPSTWYEGTVLLWQRHAGGAADAADSRGVTKPHDEISSQGPRDIDQKTQLDPVRQCRLGPAQTWMTPQLVKSGWLGFPSCGFVASPLSRSLQSPRGLVRPWSKGCQIKSSALRRLRTSAGAACPSGKHFTFFCLFGTCAPLSETRR